MIRVQGDKSHRSGGSTWAGNEFSLAFHQVLDMQIRRHFVEARHALDFVSKCVSRRPSNWRACKCRLIEWRERERRRISIQLLYTRKHFCPMAAVSIAYIYWYSGCVDCVWFPLFQTQRTEAKRSRDRKSESPVGWRTNPSGGCYRRGPVARLSKTVSRDFYKEPARRTTTTLHVRLDPLSPPPPNVASLNYSFIYLFFCVFQVSLRLLIERQNGRQHQEQNFWGAVTKRIESSAAAAASGFEQRKRGSWLPLAQLLYTSSR